MTEIKTEPVRGHLLEDIDSEKAQKGDFAFIGDPIDGIWYSCPCGCGTHGYLRIGLEKPTEAPSWKWNGNKEAPTLTPSVHHVGHWHGFLNDGVWTTA